MALKLKVAEGQNLVIGDVTIRIHRAQRGRAALHIDNPQRLDVELGPKPSTNRPLVQVHEEDIPF